MGAVGLQSLPTGVPTAPWSVRSISCPAQEFQWKEHEHAGLFRRRIEITDQVGFEPYRAAVPATIAQYGGRYLTRGSNVELIEGGPEPKRVVILEFPDVAAVRRWYNSSEYQKILPVRLANSTGRAFIVQGVT